jgi:hypothetical protein
LSAFKYRRIIGFAATEKFASLGIQILPLALNGLLFRTITPNWADLQSENRQQNYSPDGSSRQPGSTRSFPESEGCKHHRIRVDVFGFQPFRLIEAAVGGDTITTTVEGRERYPVNVRYARGLRDNLSKLSRVLIPTADGAQIPISELADLTVRTGAPMIKNEEGFLAGFVYVDTAGVDLGTYVANAQRTVAQQVQLPAGYQLVWSGQYEYLQRATERLSAEIFTSMLGESHFGQLTARPQSPFQWKICERQMLPTRDHFGFRDTK